MWIERKDELAGTARIGRVTRSKTGATLDYRGQKFRSLRGEGFKANYYELGTGQHYWISSCHKNGRDALYSTTVEIDDDARVAYWTVIRRKPGMAHVPTMRSAVNPVDRTNGSVNSPLLLFCPRRWRSPQTRTATGTGGAGGAKPTTVLMAVPPYPTNSMPYLAARAPSCCMSGWLEGEALVSAAASSK